MHRLSSILIQPLGDLEDSIFLVPSGPLNGFPFGRLIKSGEPLAKNHDVSQLMAIESLFRGGSDNKIPAKIFTAGDPVLTGSDLEELPSTRVELDRVAATFPNAEITEYRAENLTREAFTSSDYRQADLIHVSTHATLDLVYPSLSEIVLASNQPGELSVITPLEIQQTPISAKLVVLSACETSGSSQFSYDANLGFVTSLLNAGGQAVIASLWPIPDADTAAFMGMFYDEIAKGLSASNSLSNAKRLWMSEFPEKDSVWAGFQLFH